MTLMNDLKIPIRLWLLLLLVVAAGPPCAIAAEERAATSQDVSVACSADAQKRLIHVKLSNTSSVIIDIPKSGYAVDYRVDLMDQTGTPVPLTEVGKNVGDNGYREPPGSHHLRPLGSSSQFTALAPGESVTETVDLTGLYILPQEGGHFKIHMGRIFPREDSRKNQVSWCSLDTIELPPLEPSH